MPDLLEEAKRLSAWDWPRPYSRVDVTRARQVLADLVERVKQAERTLREAGSELEAGNDRGAKHLIQEALAAQQREVEGGSSAGGDAGA